MSSCKSFYTRLECMFTLEVTLAGGCSMLSGTMGNPGLIADFIRS